MEIAGGTEMAADRIKAVPSFVRAVVTERVERFAREQLASDDAGETDAVARQAEAAAGANARASAALSKTDFTIAGVNSLEESP